MIEALVIGAVAITGLVTCQDILRTWLFKKLLRNQPMDKKDLARTAMAQELELEQIKHEQQMATEKAKLAVIQANLNIIEKQALVHMQTENKFLSLPTSSITNESINDVAMPEFVSYRPITESAKNGKDNMDANDTWLKVMQSLNNSAQQKPQTYEDEYDFTSIEKSANNKPMSKSTGYEKRIKELELQAEYKIYRVTCQAEKRDVLPYWKWYDQKEQDRRIVKRKREIYWLETPAGTFTVLGGGIICFIIGMVAHFWR